MHLHIYETLLFPPLKKKKLKKRGITRRMKVISHEKNYTKAFIMFKLFRKGGVGDQYKMIQQNQEQAQSTLAFGATCWPVSALSYLELALCFSLQANAKLDQYSERCKNGRVPRQLEHTVAPILHPLSARAYGNLLVNYSSHFLGCHWSKKPRS